MLVATVVVFTALSLVLGWWSASRVMSARLRTGATPARSGTVRIPAALAPHFPEDEVGELAKALDDYAGA
jgi:HAMP domain-containing protein